MSSLDTQVKHTLRKFEFPQCAKEALVIIEQLLTGRISPTNKQVDLSMDIISEFIFLESDRRNSRRPCGLSSLQELMLVDVLCDYLGGSTNETAKNTIFLSMFSGADSQRRIKVLCTLASMAVSAPHTPTLLAVGTWLQQTGCSSPLSQQLAESVVYDQFHLQSTNPSLETLVTKAPQFLANFLAAVTDLYLHEKKDMALPPIKLLRLVTDWVTSHPSLCLSAQLTPPSLPPGAIPMAAVTALAGLVRWSAVAPLCIGEDKDMEDVIPVKKIKLEDEKELSKDITNSTESELYKNLHLGVLNSLRASRKRQGPPTAVNAQHLAAIVSTVLIKANTLSSDGFDLAVHKQLQECLDRIAQVISIALCSGCVYGNIPNLLDSLNTLPENRLLKIVIKRHQQAM